MNHTEYLYGIAAGLGSVGIVYLISYLIRTFSKKAKKKYPEYDERQIAARGQAYKTGFIILWIWTLTGIVLDDKINVLFADGSILLFTTLLICGLGIAVTCIWKDAYFPVNKNPLSLIIFITVVLILNIFFSQMSVPTFPAQLLNNGQLDKNSINPLCSIFLLIILLNVIAKTLMERQRTIRDTKNEKS